MNAYKFLHSTDIDRLLRDGTVKIRSLDYYRQLEGPQWISDQMEGKVIVDVHYSQNYDVNKIAPKGYYPLFVGGKNITIENCRFVYVYSNAFIFSASIGDLLDLTQVMCKNSRDGAAYDACVHIPSIELLAHRIFHRGVILELENQRVRDLFDDFRCDLVEYANLLRDQSYSRPPSPSPFLKHQTFQQQSEVRIAFTPKDKFNENIQSLTIKIPKSHNIFLEKFRFLNI